MVWNHPEALWLILPLSLGWLGLALFARARRRRAAAAFVAAPMWTRILPPESTGRFWARIVLWELALVSGMVALAGPRFGEEYQWVRPRGSDVYVLVDVSKSMLATDVAPSRLQRAKADVAGLLQHLHGERVGLIAFAGKAVVKCPLTTDYNSFRVALDELSTDSAPRGGTAIGDAIRRALEVLQPDADRDQCLLLITDGDDQQSYPLDAAAAAAEKRVAIFTVGLGDADKGARIPVSKSGAVNFLEYKGEQVWSKLDNSLLRDIALKTQGVYVPAGTRAYDLGELYEDHLQGRRAENAKERRRVRLTERYQWFLAEALFFLLLALQIKSYRQPTAELPALPAPTTRRGKFRASVTVTAMLALLLPLHCAAGAEEKAAPPAGEKAQGRDAPATAGETPAAQQTARDARATVEPRAAVREGLALYGQDKFEEARDKFAQAAEKLKKDQAPEASIAAFDRACAAHRKGDTAQARDGYLEAGLARDKSLAAEAHFNLGCLSAENARTLAGEQPENVPAEKRTEIVDKLKEAAMFYRHCLEIQPAHAGARRNIELVREWIKYYADRWHELDRKKRREETNLLQFVEYLIQAQGAVRESVKALKPSSSLDAFAEHKRAQDELCEETGPLKEKIKRELTPPAEMPTQPAAGAQPQQPPQPDPQQVAAAVKLLQDWADAAGNKMKGASEKLSARQPAPAAENQQGAVTEFERIWEAVVPFHALLGRDLQDQTAITHTLKPDAGEEEKKPDDKTGRRDSPVPQSDKSSEPTAGLRVPPTATPPAGGGKEPPPSKTQNGPAAKPQVDLSEAEIGALAELQEKTSHRTELLKGKAEAELKQAEQMPPPQAPQTPPPGPKDPKADPSKQPPGSAQVDPEKIKEGYRKAIELAPKAVEKMNSATEKLRGRKADSAYPDTEEARKILEEIAKAQPKKEQPKQQDQDKKDQEKQKQDEQKKEDEKKQDEQKQEKQQEEKQMSQDQINAVLRKVREREKEKHERDEKMKAMILGGTPGVEKDW